MVSVSCLWFMPMVVMFIRLVDAGIVYIIGDEGKSG